MKGTKMPLYDPTLDSYEIAQAALEQARREYKVILVDVGGDWCIWCIELNNFIESHPDLKKLIDEYYVRVRVYLSQSFSAQGTNLKFLQSLPHIHGVPHFLVYNNEGTFLHSQRTLEFEEGNSYNYERLKAFFEQWADAKMPPELTDSKKTTKVRRV